MAKACWDSPAPGRSCCAIANICATWTPSDPPPLSAGRVRAKHQADRSRLRGKLRIGNVNAVCMEPPIPEVLAFTEFRLRELGGIRHAGRIDLDRALADFSFMPVLAEHVLHESSDIACHTRLH